MISTLTVKNFKSIRNLQLSCKRINVFIGEPNTGKSNILETLAFFSFGVYYAYVQFGSFVRFERISNLFYDENIDEPIQIGSDKVAMSLSFQNGSFVGTLSDAAQKGSIYLRGGHSELNPAQSIMGDILSPFKSYKFVTKNTFPRIETEFLLPPSGDNLMSLLLAHKKLRSAANDIFAHYGLRLGLRTQESKIEVIKQLEDIIISYPYSLSSDTLQRLVFHLTAVLSNKDSVLIFEEPEAHAFPYHTKYLAEVIALDDKKNQFFISTHNPYFLMPLLEKCSPEDVAVFITYYEDYQTKVKPLDKKEIEEITEIDVFSNIDRFLAVGR